MPVDWKVTSALTCAFLTRAKISSAVRFALIWIWAYLATAFCNRGEGLLPAIIQDCDSRGNTLDAK